MVSKRWERWDNWDTFSNSFSLVFSRKTAEQMLFLEVFWLLTTRANRLLVTLLFVNLCVGICFISHDLFRVYLFTTHWTGYLEKLCTTDSAISFRFIYHENERRILGPANGTIPSILIRLLVLLASMI